MALGLLSRRERIGDGTPGGIHGGVQVLISSGPSQAPALGDREGDQAAVSWHFRSLGRAPSPDARTQDKLFADDDLPELGLRWWQWVLSWRRASIRVSVGVWEEGISTVGAGQIGASPTLLKPTIPFSDHAIAIEPREPDSVPPAPVSPKRWWRGKEIVR